MNGAKNAHQPMICSDLFAVEYNLARPSLNCFCSSVYHVSIIAHCTQSHFLPDRNSQSSSW